MDEIQNAYISVELENQSFETLRDSVREALCRRGLKCENAAEQLHVSLVYTKGTFQTGRVLEAVTDVAQESFEVEAGAFELFSGQATPYDYLIVTLQSEAKFNIAVDIIEKRLGLISLADGGFRSHISLLRFEKGSVDMKILNLLVRELNASHGAAHALGAARSRLRGTRVSVFGDDRARRMHVSFAS